MFVCVCVCAFVMIATPSVCAMIFTFITYNGAGRLGIVTDANCVENPSELIDCFMEEWKAFSMQSQ